MTRVHSKGLVLRQEYIRKALNYDKDGDDTDEQ